MILCRRSVWSAAAATLTALYCILADSLPVHSQPLVDNAEGVELEMRRKVNALVATEMQRKQLEVRLKDEHTKVPQNAVQRELHQEEIVRLEEELVRTKALEDKLRAELMTPPASTQPPSTAEADEAALGMGLVDRQHIQVALTLLGFDTRGSDGIFGAVTRDMIKGWQRRRGYQDTGFVTSAQRQVLLNEFERLKGPPAPKPVPQPVPPVQKEQPKCLGFLNCFEKEN